MKKLLQITTAALIGASILAAPAMAGGRGWGHHGGWGHKGGYGHHYGYKKHYGYNKHYGYKRHYGYKDHGYSYSNYDDCWKWVKYYYGWKKIYSCGGYDY